MIVCDCHECEEGCEQYADPGSTLCYDCSNDEHRQDRDQ